MATYILSGGEGSATLFSEHEIVCSRPMSRLTSEDLALWASEVLAGTCYRNSNLFEACNNLDDGDDSELQDDDAELFLILAEDNGQEPECWLRLEHA